MGLLILAIYGSRPKGHPDQPLQDRPGARGLYPSGTLTRTLRLRNLPEPKQTKASAQGSGARPSLTLPTTRNLSSVLDSYLAYDANQGPGTR
jgi:hypothetical protein